jgi:hypothetical protein
MTNAIYKLFLIVLAAVPLMAQSAGKIHACLLADDEIPRIFLARSQAITARMLATAGVVIDWRSKSASGCNEARSGTVKLKLVTNAPAGLHPGALAFAQLHEESEIVVMFDRIDRSAHGITGGVQVSNILANVMTHEITHLLQGIARHSETGVMKAHWSSQDLDEMAYGPLPFAPEDIPLIQLGMARRSRDSNAIAEPAAVMASH